MVVTLEMAGSLGLNIVLRADQTDSLTSEIGFDPHVGTEIQSPVDAWVPLTVAVNSLSRSMGVADRYPFILSPVVVEKLGFIQTLVRGTPSPR